MLFVSTRGKSGTVSSAHAIKEGLAEDGGLFVPRRFPQIALDDILAMHEKTYARCATQILACFLTDYTEEELQACAEAAYSPEKFGPDPAPLKKVSEFTDVLELWHGPTMAFKDIALQILPHLMTRAQKKTGDESKIAILTATSGDTGKAALAGFADVPGTEILVFYPENGVSSIQKLQMTTQKGVNTKVFGIRGNFDDAQSGVKALFEDEAFAEVLNEKGFQLSSANSINIGRLVPQVVYYVYAYVKLADAGKITMGDEIDFVVPTGNFGNILAGYYAKMIGLPVHRFICASNDNNVLYDFIKTGVYNRKRPFLKTISPSMDILISSNLERLLYYMSGCNNQYVKELMKQLNENGEYRVSDEILAKIQSIFDCGYATNEETEAVIKMVYEKDHYLLDTHTAVAYKVMLEQKDKYPCVVLSTASPYKFTRSVYESLVGNSDEDEFILMKKLNELSGTPIPNNLKDLDKKAVLHDDVIAKDEMKNYVLAKVDGLY